MFTLYYAPHSCALASHLALEEAGADYQIVPIDFTSHQQRSADYLKVNPKGRVPALATPQGTLTETPAILLYIGQTFPQAGLVPLDNTYEVARLNEFNSYLCATVQVAHAHGKRAYRWADDPAALESMRKKVPETVGACFDLIEHEFFRGPWVLGERYTVSDMYLYTLANWLEADGVDTSRCPKVMAHRQQMLARPQVQKVLAAEREMARR